MFEDLTISDTDAGLNFELKLDPDKRVYCFIGDNGVGKTVLLESLGQICWYCHNVLAERLSFGLSEAVPGLSFDTLTRLYPDLKLWVPHVISNSPQMREGGVGGYVHTIPTLTGIVPFALRQPIAFLPAHVRTNFSNIDPARMGLLGSREFIFQESIVRGLRAVMRAPIDSMTVSTWLVGRLMLNPAFFVGLRPPKEDVETLCELMQKFDPAAFGGLITPQGHAKEIGIVYHEGRLLFMGRPLESLAHGWIALIKILQEIIATLSAWEQMRGSTDILNSDALIFIDEVDAHLHPRWQVKLIPFLKEAFPRATFFLTTHSPLLVRDTEEGEVYELVKTDNLVKSRKIGNPRDWFLADVYSQAFHVDLPPPGSEGSPSLESLMMDYVEKVRDFTAGGRTEARGEALALFEQLAPRLPQDDPRMDTLLRLKGMLK